MLDHQKFVSNIDLDEQSNFEDKDDLSSDSSGYKNSPQKDFLSNKIILISKNELDKDNPDDKPNNDINEADKKEGDEQVKLSKTHTLTEEDISNPKERVQRNMKLIKKATLKLISEKTGKETLIFDMFSSTNKFREAVKIKQSKTNERSNLKSFMKMLFLFSIIDKNQLKKRELEFMSKFTVDSLSSSFNIGLQYQTNPRSLHSYAGDIDEEKLNTLFSMKHSDKCVDNAQLMLQ